MNPQMVWFQGVVEDRNDPLQLGRVKVRCVGYHTEKKQDLPTEDLPWGTLFSLLHLRESVALALHLSVLLRGLGLLDFLGMVCLLKILSSLEHSVLCVQRVILRPGEGFQDPNGNYPLDEGPNAGTDTNSLARGAGGVPLETRLNNLDVMLSADPDIPLAYNPVREPPPRYAAQYPFNHVKFTESGHVEEFDDTPGAERMHRYHRSGTFEEIGPDGERTLKVVNKNYTVVMGENDLHVVESM